MRSAIYPERRRFLRGAAAAVGRAPTKVSGLAL